MSQNSLPSQRPQEFSLHLWPNGVPNALGEKPEDIPNLTVYLPSPADATGAAVLICPGGGYGCLCSTYEGHDIAAWLNGFGIAGIVLKYRLSPYRHPVPLQDVTRAMHILRYNADNWNINPDRIGVMGFSAGGHLAATLSTHYDRGNTNAADPVERVSSRPDFTILVYPVVSMMAGTTHSGSCENLLGTTPPDELRHLLSNELHVTADTPPAFITHSTTDSAVPVANSRLLRDAMKANYVPVEYFELTSGDHGLGCGAGMEWATWQDECARWLKANHLAK